MKRICIHLLCIRSFINHLFLNFLDLTTPNVILAVMTAAAQYFQLKMMIKSQPKQAESVDGEPDIASIMNKQMNHYADRSPSLIKLASALILVFGCFDTLYDWAATVYTQHSEDRREIIG